MNYICIDTNAWIYVANGTEPRKFLTYIDEELSKGNLTVLLPEIVKTEWEADKYKDSDGTHVYNAIKENLDKIMRLSDRSSTLSFLLPHETSASEDDFFKKLDKTLKEKKEDISKAIKENIELIDKIFRSSNCIILTISDEVKLKAGTFALEKKAPFKNVNSFADALILFSFIEHVFENGIKNAMFVTYNKDDFGEKDKAKYRLAKDLIPEFEATESRFYFKLADALKVLKADIATLAEMRLIELSIDEADLEMCGPCEENGYPRLVEMSIVPELLDLRKIKRNSEPSLPEFDFKDIETETLKKLDIRLGCCNNCGTYLFECIKCGSLNEVILEMFNDEFQCNWCDSHYLFEQEYDRSSIPGEMNISILSITEQCQMCPNKFEPDVSGTNICPECEEEQRLK